MSIEGPARLAYLGTSEFAATILRRLASGPTRPALVVTPPDRPRGRGRRLAPPPAAAAAAELGFELHQTPDVNAPESIAVLERVEVDLGLVCAFGQFLKGPLLDRFELLNVHPSLLPRWRGAAPIERAIMAGDERTGVAIIRVTEGLDAGPVALRSELAIEPAEDYGSLASRLAELGGELAVRALERHAAGELRFTEQDESAMTYAEKIVPAERVINPLGAAQGEERRVRALHPHIGGRARPARRRASSNRTGMRSCSVATTGRCESPSCGRRAGGTCPPPTISAATRRRDSRRRRDRGRSRRAGAARRLRGAAADLRARGVGRPCVSGRRGPPGARGP
jgi:methionyl-tRNA formyltransferase